MLWPKWTILSNVKDYRASAFGPWFCYRMHISRIKTYIMLLWDSNVFTFFYKNELKEEVEKKQPTEQIKTKEKSRQSSLVEIKLHLRCMLLHPFFAVWLVLFLLCFFAEINLNAWFSSTIFIRAPAALHKIQYAQQILCLRNEMSTIALCAHFKK